MNVDCAKRMIEDGARLDITAYKLKCSWPVIATQGDVELLKYMFDHGIVKDATDGRGRNVLSYVVASGNIEAIRYVLDLGVTFTNYPPGTDEMRCRHCAANRLLVETDEECKSHDPCMVACKINMPHIVQLLEEHGCDNFKYTYALRHAVERGSVEVVDYLLRKYNYPLNDDYIKEPYAICGCQNLLSDACRLGSQQMVQLLLGHGADPNKKICDGAGFTVVTTAIHRDTAGVLACLIRCGVDINQESYDRLYGYVSHFEFSVRCNNIYAAEMLLVSGCSGGMYSLAKVHHLKRVVKPMMLKLLMEWNVHENNVVPLKRQCRTVLLNHLTPQADQKIKQLPLPPMLITYLGIPEIDGIMDEYNNRFYACISELDF